MKFHNKPFVFITVLLGLGILIGDQLRNYELTILILLISFIATALLLRKKSLLSNLLLLAAFVFVGMLGLIENRGEMRNVGYDGSVENKSYIVDVGEISSPERNWRKTIVTLRSEIDSLKVEDRDERVLLFIKSDKVQVGDQIMVYTSLQRIKNKGNPGEFDAQSFWNNKNIFQIGFVVENDVQLIGQNKLGRLTQFFINVRRKLSKIIDEHLKDENAAIAKALILGDKELLSAEVRNSFSSAGAMHVLAVSGLHVGIVLYILIFLFSRFPRAISKAQALFLALIVIWVYAGITGFSPSVLRASFMFSLLTIGQMLGKRLSAMNILFFSAFVLLIIEPLLVYDIGFQLSYLAMIGIYTMYGPISNLVFISNKILKKLWQGTAIGIAAQVLTVPLTLYHFHQFPNYFILTNVGMMVFAGLILGLGLALFALHWWGLLSKIIGFILGISITSMFVFIQFIEKLPGAVSTGFDLNPWMVISMFMLVLTFILFYKRKRQFIPFIALFLSVLIFVQYSRFQNMNRSEVILYNSNEVLITLKDKNRITCLHTSDDLAKSRITNLVDAYQKVQPGDTRFLKIEKGKTIVQYGKDNLVCDFDGHSLHLIHNKSDLFVRLSHYASIPEESRIINMPFIQDNPNNENLRNGAIVLF